MRKLKLGSLAPLRSSERRKIATQIITSLNLSPPAPTPTPDGGEEAEPDLAALRNSILPESAQHAKFTTAAGQDGSDIHSGTIYFGAHTEKELRPLWVKLNHSDEMFPTVYTLWKNPGLLPTIETHQPVIEKLQGGADLMIPGIHGPPFPAGAKKGKMVGITSSEREGVPQVVGRCVVDVSALKKAVGEKGRAVHVLHWFGDELYYYGGSPEPLPEAAGEDGVEGIADGVEGVRIEEDADDDTGREEIRNLTTKEIDTAFRSAAVYGIYDFRENDKADTLQFPMTSSIFISTLVMPYLPPASNFPPHNLLQNVGAHPSLHIKKSSWKNAVKFLKQLDKDALIKTKVRNGQETVVLDINWDSPEMAAFVPYKLPVVPASKEVPKPGAASEKPAGPLKVVELFRPNGRALKLFEHLKASPRDFYSRADLQKLLNTYIDSNNLSSPKNKRLVTIDPHLALLFTSSELDTLSSFKRDDLLPKLLKSCSPYYKLLSSTDNPDSIKPKSGAPPKVEIIIERRGGNKKVTRVIGVEAFGVDAKALAEELQKLCAGSATVGQAVGKKEGISEVLVQGSQEKVVVGVLKKKGVAERFVEVRDKTAGKKK